MIRTIVVPVPEGAADQLRDLARRELRTPRAQACVLILEGLRRAAMHPGARSGEGAQPAGAKPRRSRQLSGQGAGPASDADRPTDLSTGP
jgi:hypothetical protein